MFKKRNGESSEIKKRLQGKNARLGKSLPSREATKNNQQAVDKNAQAWHHLKVLDTIEIFLVLGISPRS
jgi:hypothetical protein